MCSLYQPFSRYGPQLLEGLSKVGLGRPSDAVMRATFFRHFCAGETLAGVGDVVGQYERSGVRCIFDYSVEDALSLEEWNSNTEGLIKKMRDYSATFGDRVRFVPLKVTGLCAPTLLERMSGVIYDQAAVDNAWMEGYRYQPCLGFPTKKDAVVPPLSQGERRELSEANERLSAICAEASKANLSLLFDAEQTPRQPAINWFTRKLSRQFNRERAVVFNTFQMYLQGNLDNLESELAHARDGGYILGAKVVRGAYIHTETQHARQHGLPLPIVDSKESTDVQYDVAIALLLRNIGSAALVVATHNSASVEKAMSEMQRLAIDKSSTRVNFAQLMGMCEDLTLSLGQLGYNAHKLLPYGPLENVMPYLIRRVQENSSVLGGTARERQLIWRELKRRALGSGSAAAAHA
ncbi:Proline dehydrogenase, putative [Acanthamoeba castellanii str. Neff]|uniref:Proline dehydrogenase n=1 Tax=Acanthamoeba castellanii (strain ATCC 30010 / Neff) TaxID=1257118 RepID=L8GGF7_ACACF|nr:Proline dehydrogenase, putative [Acanthamoeba castellanii str. Neff]ELR11281.1 Proline dehydrogenase, putative [Acanthamoeba castellanii str. Neff]